jgi:hypothetical protein
MGLVPPTNEEVAKNTEKELINEYNRQDIEQKLKDGKLMEAHTKHEDMMFVGGGGKGKKGKKNKQHAQKQSEPSTEKFAIDFHMINKFGLIRVSPPVSAEQLDPKIEEI